MTITESVKNQIQLGIEGKNQGFTTGLDKLDSVTGGIVHNRYIVLTSNPGGGKYINHFKFSLTNNSPNNTITKVLSINGKNAFELAYYLYNNSNIYLKRKFDKYLYFCRVYKELYTKLQTENGEVCDDNPVLSSEIKESELV